MELTDDRNGLKLQKSKRFCAIKGDNVISSIAAPLQTLGAPNTPLSIVHSVFVHFRISSSLSFQWKTKRNVFLLLFVLTPAHLNWSSYATGKC